jgi:hypothetical protein
LQGSAFVCSPFGTLLPPQTEEKIAEDDTTERTEMAPDSKDFKLAEVVRNNLMKKLKLQLSLAELDNGVLVRLAKGEASEVLEGPFDGVPLMEEWVKQRMLPLVPVVTGANFGDLLRMKKRLAFIVTDPMVPNAKRFLESMFPLALYYRGDFTFGALDAQMYSHYVEQFNVRSYPTVFVFDSDNEVYYVDDTPLPMFSDVTDESLPFSSTVPSDLVLEAAGRWGSVGG